jgi:hypothetical protein
MNNVTVEYYTLCPSFRYRTNKAVGYNGKVRLLKSSARICLQVSPDLLYTGQLSATLKVLRKQLPSIFKCECFNEDNRPFREEVKNTELGHLFEHVLLEFLCKEKLNDGCDFADFSGVTNWNWKRDPRGTFHIHIGMKKEESMYFYKALQQTIEIINSIIDQSDSSDWNPTFISENRLQPAIVSTF